MRQRKTIRLTKLIRRAEFLQSDACIEDVEYHADRKLDKAQISRWLPADTLREHNIILGLPEDW
ncbi:MAG: hypothetical protein U5R30_12595 [Deltaproteobacteria bacterium]|nr:hypothetical protein [Deltaproteobacteria bacterium]